MYDANRVWNYFNSNDIPEQFTSNGRQVKALYSSANGAVSMLVENKIIHQRIRELFLALCYSYSRFKLLLLQIRTKMCSKSTDITLYFNRQRGL